ncbi:E3 ubiquitin-protein ligase RLIM-like [Mustela nigripes]|uniref:RING-type E3 ubiquitin transferase n=1 Tax=Mustela putorius furo TaxID=9669 RepID=M3XTC3_MUSPF|nr:E3 ubiquitin-protein ligase RLIM-like [Mustela putorius furo]XP_059241260.1 E3 ubiquitin-protein ligase RLIM-like [Mustela nigripes]
MENSGFDDEDKSAALRRSQRDRLVREEDFYQFVNNLSEEDYKLMRDNDLLGIPGETTLEELQRRLQRIKDNPPQNSDKNTGGGDSSDNSSSGDSLLNWVNSFQQTENVTSRQTEHQIWEELSQINSNNNNTRFGLEMNFNVNNGSPNPENKDVPSTRFPRGDNIENIQRQAENTQSESTFIRPPMSEQSTTEALIEVPVTRGQRRARSRSPEHRRTRARIESSSAPNSWSDLLLRFHQSIAPETFEQLLEEENELYSRIQHQETSGQQITGTEPQNSGLFSTSGTRNAVQEESSPDTTSDGESWEVEQISSTILFNLEVGQVHLGAYSHSDSIASRTPLTCETPTLESEQGGLWNMFPSFEQTDATAYLSTIGIPIHRILNTDLNDTISTTIQSTLTQTVTTFSGSIDLMDSDSDLVHSISPPSENMERAESPNERDGSGDRTSSGSNSTTSSDFHSSFPLISSSNSSYITSFNSSPISSSSSSDENSEIRSLMFDGTNEISLSSGSPSEARQESRPMSPIIFDESNSWTSLNLDHFFLLNEDYHDRTTGLTKAQIDNLAVRSFGKSGALKACSICITEYTEGNRLRILPCSHEFHIHCIDRWLLENSTCPICRRKAVESGERENSN